VNHDKVEIVPPVQGIRMENALVESGPVQDTRTQSTQVDAEPIRPAPVESSSFDSLIDHASASRAEVAVVPEVAEVVEPVEPVVARSVPEETRAPQVAEPERAAQPAPSTLLVEMFAKRMQDPIVPSPAEVAAASAPMALPALEPINLPEGMEMVETRNDRTAGGPVEEASLEPLRRSRQRPAAPIALADEPMQQVETRK